MHRFVEGTFKRGSTHTIGVEFGSRIVEVGGRRVKLQLWDTAGQERYRSVTRSYYRGAAGALIVYDLTSRESYEHLINWIADARTLARADISVMAIGNKLDVKDRRHVSFLEASRFAQESDMLFLETSAITGEGVEEAFLRVARNILNKIEDGLIDPNTMVLGTDPSYRTNLSPSELPRSAVKVIFVGISRLRCVAETSLSSWRLPLLQCPYCCHENRCISQSTGTALHASLPTSSALPFDPPLIFGLRASKICCRG
eukprot:GHVT01017354.1.p1 GENE.GHVT01017354.1~~GHVT01017354.1.p1  ORF type:complete len:257 (-),score=37.72 GHVT01017354.1:124-894(-)